MKIHQFIINIINIFYFFYLKIIEKIKRKILFLSQNLQDIKLYSIIELINENGKWKINFPETAGQTILIIIAHKFNSPETYFEINGR